MKSQSTSSVPPLALKMTLLQYLMEYFSKEDMDFLTVYDTVGRYSTGGIARLKPPLYSEQWVVNDPLAIQHILKSNQDNYRKGPEYETLGLMTPEGLLVAEGDTWISHRRLMKKGFSTRSVDALAEIMVAETNSMVARWKRQTGDGQSLNVYPELRNLSLRIVVRSLFSTDMSYGLLDQVSRGFDYLNWYLDDKLGEIVSIPLPVPTHKNLHYKRAIRDVEDAVFYVLKQRRRRETRDDYYVTPQNDLLDILMFAHDARTDAPLTDDQLRDQVLTLLIAGHDTTANALTWTFDLLARNPKVDQTLHEEATSVLAGRSPIAEDYSRLPYTKAVMQETLRLYPPLWSISRVPVADDELCGYHVPAGTHLILSPYVTHRDPRFWDEPDEFRPQRFLPNSHEPIHEFSYFPFGGGKRRCLGERFAQMAMVLILADIYQHYRLELEDPESVTATNPLLTLRPDGDLPMKLRPR